VTPQLILASKSPSRAQILKGAGLPFTAEAASVDEAEVKAALRAEGAPAARAAEALAELKARRVAARHPHALVLGGDQMLACAERWFDKPRDRADAREQIAHLAGRPHELLTALCIVQGAERQWHHVATARLVMRPLSSAAIDAYLDMVGDQVLASPGGYQIEGPGIQLFAHVEGDYFGILGMPLLPLLAYLRGRGLGLP